MSFEKNNLPLGSGELDLKQFAVRQQAVQKAVSHEKRKMRNAA